MRGTLMRECAATLAVVVGWTALAAGLYEVHAYWPTVGNWITYGAMAVGAVSFIARRSS